MQHAARSIASFDPSDEGTPEYRWLQALSKSPPWQPEPGPLIVVSPHPDDEVLGAGGLIHTWATSGHPVTIVSVTDGEAAFPLWKGLDLVRRDELKAALRKLCPKHVSVVRVGLPDGDVARHANRLRNALLPFLDASTTLIAPYEHDGHPDHDVAGEVCRGLARSHGIALARYPVWSWHHTDPAALDDLTWGRFALSVEARRVKQRALECFASQLCPPNAAAIMPSHVLKHFERSYEAFIL